MEALRFVSAVELAEDIVNCGVVVGRVNVDSRVNARLEAKYRG